MTGTPSQPMPKSCPTCSQALDMRTGECPSCRWRWESPHATTTRKGLFGLPEMRYQNHYLWATLFAALDIMLTYVVLHHWGGYEANPIAAAVIATKPFYYATIFKFALVVLAFIICEVVGRMNDRDGRKLALAIVLFSAVPVVYTFTLLINNPHPSTMDSIGG